MVAEDPASRRQLADSIVNRLLPCSAERDSHTLIKQPLHDSAADSTCSARYHSNFVLQVVLRHLNIPLSCLCPALCLDTTSRVPYH
jgi:hypothetical protein